MDKTELLDNCKKQLITLNQSLDSNVIKQLYDELDFFIPEKVINI